MFRGCFHDFCYIPFPHLVPSTTHISFSIYFSLHKSRSRLFFTYFPCLLLLGFPLYSLAFPRHLSPSPPSRSLHNSSSRCRQGSDAVHFVVDLTQHPIEPPATCPRTALSPQQTHHRGLAGSAALGGSWREEWGVRSWLTVARWKGRCFVIPASAIWSWCCGAVTQWSN